MAALDAFVVRLAAILNLIGGLVVLPAMTLMMTADVVLRYVFNAPLSWGLEASQYMLLLVFILGMVEAFRSGAHIRMDLIYRMLPLAMRRLVTAFYSLITIGVFVLLARKSIEEAEFLRGIDEVTQYIHMPRWLFAAAIGFAACLIVLFFLVRLVAVLRGQRELVEDGEGHFAEPE